MPVIEIEGDILTNSEFREARNKLTVAREQNTNEELFVRFKGTDLINSSLIAHMLYLGNTHKSGIKIETDSKRLGETLEKLGIMKSIPVFRADNS